MIDPHRNFHMTLAVLVFLQIALVVAMALAG
jgi:hypothetical protein